MAALLSDARSTSITASHNTSFHDRLDVQDSILNQENERTTQHSRDSGNDRENHDDDASNLLAFQDDNSLRPSQLSPPSIKLSSHESELRDPKYGAIERFCPWFPKMDPQFHEAKGIRSWRIWHSKRHIILWTAFASSMVVLLANLILVAVLGSKYGITSRRGLIKLYEGDCDRAKLIGTGSHVGINILSTLLLSASNLCMQLIVAPTRREIDAAHRKKIWLDIGIPSWRNLSNIKQSRRWLFSALMLSSVPLHFIYNSAISVSIPVYGYPTIVASEHFVRGTDLSIGNWTNITLQGKSDKGWNNWPSTNIWNSSKAFENIRMNANNTALYEKLENRQCIERYSNVFSNRSSLVVVTENLPGDQNSSVHQYLYWPAAYGGYSRYNPCNSGDSRAANPDCQDLSANSPERYKKWKRFDRTVLYCLSERISDHCQVNYSPAIFIAVCCFSYVKCVCILITILFHEEPTISTIGDAIASFLEFPDETSAHMGPVTKSTFANGDAKAWEEVKIFDWRPKTKFWHSAPSWKRIFISITLCIIVAIVALVCGIGGAIGSRKRLGTMSFAWQMKQPIGVPNPNAFTAYFLPRYGMKGFIANVMYANIWQAIISFLYLAYNALLTCMLVTDEWSRFAKCRKTLRVTHPRGIQRSTYFISMPYKYGIPLMIANTVLHILVSQSLFIISTITYYPNLVEDLDNSYTVTGYSTSALIISLCVGVTTLIILIGISFFKVSSKIPLVSTCSIAISAACHRPREDSDAHLLPVIWGVISPDTDPVVRCSLTTFKNVRSPRVGERIVGEKLQCEVDWVQVPVPWTQKVFKSIRIQERTTRILSIST